MRRTAAIKNSHDRPLAFADMDCIADVGMLEPLVNRTAYHHLALPRRKPAPGNDVNLRPHLDSERRQKAGSNVGVSGSAFARQTTTSMSSPETSGSPLLFF